MPAVKMRDDYSGEELRALAAQARDGAQARRLMALAAIADGKSREEAAAIGLMSRQTLRDWVHRFNAEGPEGLVNRKSPGKPSKLTAAQKKELAAIVAEGPQKHVPSLARWRCVDLQKLIKERFGVDYHPTSISRLLHALGFSHVSARPRHPRQDEEVIEDFKKLCRSPG